MRFATLSGASVLLLAMTGCISSTTVVKVKPDGSGTVVQTTTMNAKIAAQMKEMMAEMKAMGGEKPGEGGTKPAESGTLFSESDAKSKAAKMGEDVRFISSERINTSEAEGIRAIYAFSDITKLKIDEKPSTPGPGGPGMAPKDGGKEEMAFRFSKQANGNSLLTISVPQKKSETTGSTSTDTGVRPSGESSPEQLAQIKEIFKGMRISIAVEVDGKLVKTNGAYVNGPTVTLVEMDFGQLLSNEAKLMELSGIKSMEEAKKALKDLTGFKIDLGPEITIEFAGK